MRLYIIPLPRLPLSTLLVYYYNKLQCPSVKFQIQHDEM